MNFGFLVFTDVEELDFTGPWEMIGLWSKYFGGPERYFLVSQTGETVVCAKGLKVVPDYRFDNCPKLDYLLIPGGFGTRREVTNPALLAFVKTHAAECRQVLSVCTGSFVLEAAGLLKGKKATTYWDSLNRLRQQPGVEVVEQRFVRDGNVWTAAGVSAGIDLALALIADQAGEEVAGKVQLGAEYFPCSRRYGQAHLAEGTPAYLKDAL